MDKTIETLKSIEEYIKTKQQDNITIDEEPNLELDSKPKSMINMINFQIPEVFTFDKSYKNNIKTFIVVNMDLTHIKTCYKAFFGCDNLETFVWRNCKTNPIDCSFMFSCSSLKSIHISKLVVSDARNMFCFGNEYTKFDLEIDYSNCSNFNCFMSSLTKNVIDFKKCKPSRICYSGDLYLNCPNTIIKHMNRVFTHIPFDSVININSDTLDLSSFDINPISLSNHRTPDLSMIMICISIYNHPVIYKHIYYPDVYIRDCYVHIYIHNLDLQTLKLPTFINCYVNLQYVISHYWVCVQNNKEVSDQVVYEIKCATEGCKLFIPIYLKDDPICIECVKRYGFEDVLYRELNEIQNPSLLKC